MSNVLYVCPEDDCATRAYAHPDGTLPNPRCTQHDKSMVLDDKHALDNQQFDRAKYEEPVGITETPTSIDAVTRDGKIVGVEVGLGSPGHGIAPKASSSSTSTSKASSSASKSAAKKS